jgi:hypothetical protein
MFATSVTECYSGELHKNQTESTASVVLVTPPLLNGKFEVFSEGGFCGCFSLIGSIEIELPPKRAALLLRQPPG